MQEKSTIDILDLNDPRGKALLQRLSRLILNRLQESNVRKQSITGCGHRRKLGMILTCMKS